MTTMTIDFKHQADKEKIQQIIAILDMDVTIHQDEPVVPESHYAKLDKDLEAYGKGELELKTWEEVENGIREKINV